MNFTFPDLSSYMPSILSSENPTNVDAIKNDKIFYDSLVTVLNKIKDENILNCKNASINFSATSKSENTNFNNNLSKDNIVLISSREDLLAHINAMRNLNLISHKHDPLVSEMKILLKIKWLTPNETSVKTIGEAFLNESKQLVVFFQTSYKKI